MKRSLIWVCLLFTGCLANFDPFKEADFLNAYSETICTMMADCSDQNPDNNLDSPYANQGQAICESYVWDPNNKGCTIQAQKAVECYEEALEIADEVYEAQDCDLLRDWSQSTSKSCNVTYINCITDRPFGTLPFGGAEWN